MTTHSDSTLSPRPPVDEATLRAARRFLDMAEARYPVRDAYLFGSRARGTHAPDSDADVAVVLRGAAIMDMAGIAYDVMMDLDILIEATPLWEADFDESERKSTRYLVRNIRHEGIRL